MQFRERLRMEPSREGGAWSLRERAAHGAFGERAAHGVSGEGCAATALDFVGRFCASGGFPRAVYSFSARKPSRSLLPIRFS
jgi:hypothetical protein